MEQPEPFSLIVTIGLANPHLMEREAGLMHSIIEMIVWFLRVLSMVGPDVRRMPVIDRVNIIQGLATPRSKAFAIHGLFLARRDGAPSVQTLAGPNAHKAGCELVLTIPVPELRYKLLKFHLPAEEGEEFFIGDRDLRGLPDKRFLNPIRRMLFLKSDHM